MIPGPVRLHAGAEAPLGGLLWNIGSELVKEGG